MRTDETGQPCPETLGEYLDMCKTFAALIDEGSKSEAVHFLEQKIAQQGRDEVVIAPDSQMRFLLMPMLFKPYKASEG